MSDNERVPLTEDQLSVFLAKLDSEERASLTSLAAQEELKAYWVRQKSISPSLAALRLLATITEEGASFAQVLIASKRKRPELDMAPPSTFLLDLLMNPEEAADAAANLEDYFPAWVEKHGPARAARIFRFQAGRILVGYWWGRIMTQVERVVKSVSVFVRTGGN